MCRAFHRRCAGKRLGRGHPRHRRGIRTVSLGRSTSLDQQFEVFGRDQAERPLSHIGGIVAPNRELAVARARILYSERQWVELYVAPAESFMDCLRRGRDGTVGLA